MRIRTGQLFSLVALAGAMSVLGACGGSDDKTAQTIEPAKGASVSLAQGFSGARSANATGAARVPQVSLPEGKGPLGVAVPKSENSASGSTESFGYRVE